MTNKQLCFLRVSDSKIIKHFTNTHTEVRKNAHLMSQGYTYRIERYDSDS